MKDVYSDQAFGFGNCYGFAAIALGRSLPKGAVNEDFAVGGLVGEGVAGATMDKPQVYNPFERFLPNKRYDGVRTLIPEGGLIKFLIGNRKETATPLFGTLALFGSKLGVTHAAIVLGSNQKGEVILLQKLNASCPCGVSSVAHPILKDFGKPKFYK